MVDTYGLEETRSAIVDAKTKIENYKAIAPQERFAQFKASLRDEHAGLEAGVVTLTQAEAKFFDLNIRAYTDMSDYFCQARDIQPGETGFFKTRAFNTIGVRSVSLSGESNGIKFASVQNGFPVSTSAFGTSKYIVPAIVNDNYDIAKFLERESAVERAAYELKLAKQQYRINAMLGQPLSMPLAQSIPAYFNAPPAIGSGAYVLDQGVQQGSMATTNALDLTNFGGSPLVKYAWKKLATQMFLQHKTPVAMFVPVDPGVWEPRFDEASVVALANGQGNQNPANTIPPAEWEKRLNTGFSEQGQYIEMFGMRIWVQPVNILPVGYALVATNYAAVLEYNKLAGFYTDEQSAGNTPQMRGYNTRVDYIDCGWLSPAPALLNFTVLKY
jgi:hypothetical protein